MKTLMIIMTALQLVGTLPMFASWMFLPMMFDSPQSINDNNVWLMFWSVIALPFVIMLINALGWIFTYYDVLTTGFCLVLVGFLSEVMIYGLLWYYVLN